MELYPENVTFLYQKYVESSGISTDTRKIQTNSIFFALKGPNFNGNAFAAKALELGAKCAVIDDPQYSTQNTVLVKDVLTTLQKLANYHRKQLNIPVIGVAGSNGKTTTKELVYTILKTEYQTFATQGNLNNHIGVPLSILSIPPKTKIAVLELGANHLGELECLCHIAEPTLGVITNNGLDHLEGYGSYENVIKGNGELFDWLYKSQGIPFINATDETLMNMASKFKKKILYGTENDCINIHIAEEHHYLTLSINGTEKVKTQLFGSYNIHNIRAAVAFATYFNIPYPKIIQAIENYIPSNNRSQLLQKQNLDIVLDCYNANPTSMVASIDSFMNLNKDPKYMILGDMLELGAFSTTEHQKIVNKCATLTPRVSVYFCGNAFYSSKIPKQGLHFFESRADLERHLASLNEPLAGCVLLKGSRGMALEKLIEML